MTTMTDDKRPQLDKFKQAARALECDDDADRFKARVGKLVKHKPVDKAEPAS
jgi:hypothetical protein